MKYILETINLTKKYQDSVVVDNVSIHVPQGKIYALLGRNGAGKTTLMKMILRLISVTEGSVKLFNEESGKQNTSIFQNIGSMIESPGFYENLTAYENLRLLMRLRGHQNEGELIKALEIVGLHNERSKPFADYSLGMKQRLGIAAALMHNPKILLLDEPINGLDPIGISEIRTLLKTLRQDKGTTILISSHDLSEIEQIADIIGVMQNGRLIEEINLIELNNRNKSYIDIEVSNCEKALDVLNNSFQQIVCVKQDDRIRVFDPQVSSGIMNKVLVENGLLVTRINVCQESLEEYFSQLIGGKGIA